MTTSIAKSMSTIFKEARLAPVIPLLYCIKDILQRWFYERQNSSAAHINNSITKELDKILQQFRKASINFYGVLANLYEFEVHGDDLIGQVNLRSRICSCHKLMLDGCPCVHAFIVCEDCNIHHIFCAIFFTLLFFSMQLTLKPLACFYFYPRHGYVST